jgi:hypothetical protein
MVESRDQRAQCEIAMGDGSALFDALLAIPDASVRVMCGPIG